MRPRNEGGAVLMGASASLLLQPSEFIESRKEAEAMLPVGRGSENTRWVLAGLAMARGEGDGREKLWSKPQQATQRWAGLGGAS
jgi:hypothetical protein